MGLFHRPMRNCCYVITCEIKQHDGYKKSRGRKSQIQKDKKKAKGKHKKKGGTNKNNHEVERSTKVQERKK